MVSPLPCLVPGLAGWVRWDEIVFLSSRSLCTRLPGFPPSEAIPDSSDGSRLPQKRGSKKPGQKLPGLRLRSSQNHHFYSMLLVRQGTESAQVPGERSGFHFSTGGVEENLQPSFTYHRGYALQFY